eukprot:1872065-Lingulodinium_polyedra.AAC.1
MAGASGKMRRGEGSLQKEPRPPPSRPPSGTWSPPVGMPRRTSAGRRSTPGRRRAGPGATTASPPSR